MQLFYQRFNVQEYLLFTLLAITSCVLISNIFDVEIAGKITTTFSIILSSIVMILSIFMVSKYGLKGNHGKSWILFMLFSAYWFCAESVNTLYGVFFGENAWAYADDFFYITGYQLFFASLVFYLKPFAQQISKKLVLCVSIFAISLVIPSLFMILESKPDAVNDNVLVLFSYPVLDSLVLIPAIIGIILFFKGGVNFMVTLFGLGIISQIVGHNSMLFLTLQHSYYPGHLVEVLFLWTYVMFTFGISNQLKLFNGKSENNSISEFGSN